MITIPENTPCRWVAGLSNGETLVERQGKVAIVKGEASPWWKLQEYLEKNNLTIQSFGIWDGDKHYNLPSAKPKFGGEVPLKYNCFRKLSSDGLMSEGNVEHYICAEAIYSSFTVQLWVNELDSNKMWLNINVHKQE